MLSQAIDPRLSSLHPTLGERLTFPQLSRLSTFGQRQNTASSPLGIYTVVRQNDSVPCTIPAHFPIVIMVTFNLSQVSALLLVFAFQFALGAAVPEPITQATEPIAITRPTRTIESPKPTQTCAPPGGQCGGITYRGPLCCQPPSICVYIDQWCVSERSSTHHSAGNVG